MPRRYSNPVTEAIFLAGRSIQRGYGRLGEAHLSAADFTLKEAEQDLKFREFEADAPIREQKRKSALNFLEEQEFLDEPLGTKDVFPVLMGKTPLPHQIDHMVSNDIPGKILDTLGATIKDGMIYGPRGKQFTRRRLKQYAPVIAGLIDANTAPERVYQDELDYLRDKQAKGEKLDPQEETVLKSYEALEKDITKYAKHFMKQYHLQDSRLLNLKANLVAMGADTSVVDDALRRNARISGEFLTMLKVQKALEGRQLSLRPGITQKDIATLSLNAMKNADKKISDLRFEGSFEDFQGSGLPWTKEQIEAYRNKLVEDDVLNALKNADAITSKYVTPQITIKERGPAKTEPKPKPDLVDSRKKQKDLIAEGEKVRGKKQQAKKQEQDKRLRRSQDAFKLIRDAMQ